VLRTLTSAALDSAGITGTDITAAGYGIAGYDWSEDEPLIHEVIQSLNFDAPYEVMNDAGPSLLAGSSNGWGVSVTAGTSVNARGRDAQGRQARMTGNGVAFGEVGGGLELVGRAIRDISTAWTMCGPETMLTEVFIQHTGAKNVEDLLAGIARGRYEIQAAAAPLVFQAANAGDAVAQNAVRWLGHGLGKLACGMIRQLKIADLTFDVVLSGSIFQGSPVILERMQTVVHQLAPQARFVHLHAPPVTGAVMLAMEQAGVDFRPLRPIILTSALPMLTIQEKSI
jgi:N-acetylglucosamine kinase-like BadF-type ATPase